MTDSFKISQGLERRRIEAQLTEIEAEIRQSEFDMARLKKGAAGDPMLDALRANRKKRQDDERIRSGRGLIYKTTIR
jgi:hypothetical protein